MRFQLLCWTRRLIPAVVTLASLPAFGADAQNGAVLARRWCASCHIVASDQRQSASEATPFREIATKANFDAAKLAFFLLNPHPVMPNMGLSRNEAADLAAYIASFK
jgi:mono/diheme cytochrome c family protein